MPKKSNASRPSRRNKNYADTHRVLVEKAVELIAASGVDAVSISALARATQINRSTVYYHFDSCDDLIAAVRTWSSEQLGQRANPANLAQADGGSMSSFVLGHPDIIKLWIDDFIAAGDIRLRFPHWESLVARVAEAFAEQAPDENCDAEVYCALMLTSALIAPRVFKNSVQPQESMENVVARFSREQRRIMQREGVMASWLRYGMGDSGPASVAA